MFLFVCFVCGVFCCFYFKLENAAVLIIWFGGYCIMISVSYKRSGLFTSGKKKEHKLNNNSNCTFIINTVIPLY